MPESKEAGLPTPPDHHAGDVAVFLDLDGTLAPIVADPHAARVPPDTLLMLENLSTATDGALAIVTGRAATDLERMVKPLLPCYAALHGGQLRWPDGRIEELAIPREDLERLTARLKATSERMPGTLIEAKPLSVAFHFRGAPQCEAQVRAAARDVLKGHEEVFSLQEGKMVIEIKPRAAQKGAALRRLMKVAPFRSRMPVFAGDDLTDESAFAAVNDLGGTSIKIGPGATQARWRLPDPPALTSWLAGLLR